MSTPINIAVIPGFWSQTHDGSSTLWTINSDDPVTRASIVYPFMKDGKTTIRLTPNHTLIPLQVNNGGIYELNGHKTPVKPGDHVVMNIWVMTDPATVERDNIYYEIDYWGMNVGVDIWTRNVNGRVCEIRTQNGITTYPTFPDLAPNCVRFGTATPQKITLDFIVESQYIADPWGAYPVDSLVTPELIIPILTGQSSNPSLETAATYIVATELYINPEAPEVPPEIPPSKYNYSTLHSPLVHMPLLATKLFKLRDKIISRDLHNKIHPLV